MTHTWPSSAALSDSELLVEVKAAAARERRATAELIALLAELDGRRLYLGQGCSSLFTYCTQVLHLSEHAAYGRIEAGRAARRFPLVLELLGNGTVTLTAITLLAPHLTDSNHRDVLNDARHKSKREVEHIVARLRPQPPVTTVLRKLPSPTIHADSAGQANQKGQFATADCGGVDSAASDVPQPRPAVVAPLALDRYRLQFTMSRETHDKLRRAQDLLRHSIPNGDPAAIVDRALTLLIDHFWSGQDLQRPPVLGHRGPHPQARVIFRHQSNAKSGRAMAGGARSRASRGAVSNAVFWSITTSSLTRMAGPSPQRTSSCAAGRTTSTRQKRSDCS